MEYDEYEGKHQRMLPMRCYIKASLQSWEMGSANQQKLKLNLCLRVKQTKAPSHDKWCCMGRNASILIEKKGQEGRVI